MTEHEQRAGGSDDQADQMQEQSDRLEEEIADVRKDWERKQADDAVPGAVGEPASADDLPPPEPDETD